MTCKITRLSGEETSNRAAPKRDILAVCMAIPACALLVLFLPLLALSGFVCWSCVAGLMYFSGSKHPRLSVRVIP